MPKKHSVDPFDRILAALHRAALDEARWPEADRLIGELSGTRGSGLAIFGGTSQADGTAFFVRICVDGQRREDWERSYFENYYAEDERVPRILRQPCGRITRTQDLFTDAEKKTSLIYNELLVDPEVRNGLNMQLDSPMRSASPVDGPPSR